MNKLFSARIASAILLLLLISSASFAADMRTTLKRGIFSKQLVVKATSNGGLWANSLKLSITNTSDKNMSVTVDPGLIFVPDDTLYQNLVTLGSETLAIAPSATVDINLHAYCGKSYAFGPKKNLNYKFWKQGDSVMVKTLGYIKTNQVGNSLAQSAVWMFTNGHCLSTVYDHKEPAASENLIKYIAELKKYKIPEVFTELAQNNRPDQPAILENGATKLFVPIKWKNENVRHMRVTILKENGDIYRKIDGHEEINKDGHTVWVEFNSVNDRKGNYFIELKDESSRVWARKQVTIGYDPCSMSL